MIQETIVIFATTGCDYNNQIETIKALFLADWCWAAVNALHLQGEGLVKDTIKAGKIIYGIGEGVTNGVYNTAHAILHPVQYVTDMAAAIKFLAKGTTRVLIEIARVDYLVENEPEEARKHIKYLSDNIWAIA